MKIAMISYHTCPLASEEGKETGGMNVYVLALAKALGRAGHTVDMFTRGTDPSNKRIVPVAERVRLMHLFAGPPQPLPKKELLHYLHPFSENIREFIAEQNITYDIIHCHYYMSGMIHTLLRQYIPPVPVVHTFHTLALLKNLVGRSESEREEDVRIKAEMELVKTGDAIITPSISDAQYLTSLYEARHEKLNTIPPGVDTSLFRPSDKSNARQHLGLPPDQKILLFVGRIEPLKGIDVLLYAMKILKQRNGDMAVNLMIVGGDLSETPEKWDEELKKLDRLRNLLRLESTVQFVGRKPQETLPWYYNASDLVVMPSHYESFGIVALEAMACGVPVITTDVAGISTILDEEHTSLVTGVNNPLSLASLIEETLENEAKHKKIATDISKKVQDLDWDNIARRVIGVYSQLEYR